ncbi:hypothetical protein BJ138DRAFT_999156 [Hygrophoropsis aurantiaca]|uniref:Uncharacterized protein n=1 Tax=Hygrophoropsis aurantiaca TaxID=72124 RepID=A0ACB8ANQ7_9AGAM|nr:hypothetical protein BJ138DRAFT_999156 [Hygrophoropsis aurantiaca]
MFQDSSLVDPFDLTSILPVTMQSLPTLEADLISLVARSNHLHTILLVFSENMLSEIRRKIHALSRDRILDHTDLTLLPQLTSVSSDVATLLAASHVRTEWLLVLDEHGFKGIDAATRTILLNPLTIGLPVGSRGFVALSHNMTRVTPLEIPQPVDYLIPPFVGPTSLITSFAEITTFGLDVWPALGKYVAQSRLDMIGGIPGFSPLPAKVSQSPSKKVVPNLDVVSFGIAFPSRNDLMSFSRVVCRLRKHGYSVNVLLYDASTTNPGEDAEVGAKEVISTPDCVIEFATLSDDVQDFAEWLYFFDDIPQVIVALDQQDFFSVSLALELQKYPYLDTSLVRLARADLPYSDWMVSLTIEEWKSFSDADESDWNAPEITIIVITNNRPNSLHRLLDSLKNACYFGNNIGLRINMEQTADSETLRLVRDFSWEHGSLFINHRVIHGGLLPAVVESWYPHSNDSYGLLLEDDIEVSPLFYAWAKMAILRYSNNCSQLFGISLYQQKNIELRPEGRLPFNARTLFTNHDLREPTTPYLSQIPCSWGAVYFPQHWREFHDYLALRLSEHSMTIHEHIVPDVRSNKWTKSWKKYFIELVYLRGYVMLYPNFDNFVSLSTNHLEIGSHVKNQPEDEYLRKQDLFLLPLMPLCDRASVTTSCTSGLLQLPNQTLPQWSALPALDLKGSLSSVDALVRQGNARREKLTQCCRAASLPFDVPDLMCLNDPLS